MKDTTATEIRKIDARIAMGEDAGPEYDGRAAVLANEQRLFEQMQARQGDGTGWTLASATTLPMHRLAIANPPTAALARKLAAQAPLTNRIFEYGQMEWWQTRKLVDLTDEEINSSFVYWEAYEALVAKKKAPARPVRETAPDQEPSPGELYRIAGALLVKADTIPLKHPLRRLALVLHTALKDGMGAVKAIEHTFRDAPGTEAQTLTALEIYVPEVARLVLWLLAKEAA